MSEIIALILPPFCLPFRVALTVASAVLPQKVETLSDELCRTFRAYFFLSLYPLESAILH